MVVCGVGAALCTKVTKVRRTSNDRSDTVDQGKLERGKESASHLVYPDADHLAHAAAEHFTTLATKAIATRGQFAVALSGGSTPRATYTLLATEEFTAGVDWPRVHIFWADERCVPPDDPGSNYWMTREALLDHVPLLASNIHRIRGEMEPEAAAQAYAVELRAFFGTQWPSFDLVLLGMGNDGHTASLFPGSAALHEETRPAVAVTAHYQDRPAHRVTLTLPAINAARQVIVLATGAAKAETLQAVLEGPADRFPAQFIRPTSGQLTWLVDSAAARKLKKQVWCKALIAQ
jgi:6-phosphogluconolactonase